MSKKFNPDINPQIGTILSDAKRLAIEYRSITGKPLGITSEVAEYEAAIHLNCKLLDARTPGHDLIDCFGNKVQVKGRVIYNNKTQKVPTINKSTEKKSWDYVVLVILDSNYNATEIYKLEQEPLEKLFETPRPNGSYRVKRDLSVRKFKELCNNVPIWKR